MSKKLGLIPKVLSGEKKIETRWYASRRAPWNCIAKGDRVWFKNSGGPVCAYATVSKVIQYADSTSHTVDKIIKRYGKDICFVEKDMQKVMLYLFKKRYAILIFLKEPREVKAFYITKRGFGSGSAWLSIPTIEILRI